MVFNSRVPYKRRKSSQGYALFVDPRYKVFKRYINVRVCASVLSCQTLCDPMDSSPPVSSVHGIFPARILEWVAISSYKGSHQPRD